MRRFFDYSIAVFVTGCSLFYLPGLPFADAQIDFFKVGVCALFVLSTFLAPRRHMVNPFLNLFLGLATVVLVALPENVKTVMIAPYVHLFLAVVLFYLVANYLVDRTLIYKGMAAVVAVNCVMVALQILGVDPICLNDRGLQNGHWVGLFGYKMNLGAYAALALPIFASLGLGILAVGSVFLCIASKSWGAWVAMTAGILFYLQRAHARLFRKMLLGVVILGLVGAAAVAIHPNVLNKLIVRYELQKPMVGIAFRSPYVGYGMGSIHYIFEQERQERLKLTGKDYGSSYELWNDYLESAVMLGFGALILWVLLIRRTWRIFLLRKRSPELLGLTASLLTIAVGMLFHSYMNFPNVGVISLVLLACFEITQREVASEN